MNKMRVNPYERSMDFSFEKPRDAFNRPPERELTQEEKLEKERKIAEWVKKLIDQNARFKTLSEYYTRVGNVEQEAVKKEYDEILKQPDYIFSEWYERLTKIETSRADIWQEKIIIASNTIPNIWVSHKKAEIGWEVKAEHHSKVKEQVNTTEVGTPTKEEKAELEKAKEYAMIANLAYAKVERVDKGKEMTLSNLKVKEVSLDIASIDFTKFTVESNGKLSAPNEKDLTPDEAFVLANFNNPDVYNQSPKTMITDTNDKNVSDVIDVALFRNNQKLDELRKASPSSHNTLASLDIDTDISNTGNTILSDVGGNILDASQWFSLNWPNINESQILQKYREFLQEHRGKLTEILSRLKWEKKTDYEKQFEKLKEKWDFKILAHYPEENSDDKSGFQCVLFEKNGKKILSITGTQLNNIYDADTGDLGADIDLYNWKLPEAQVKSLINFCRKHLNGNEKVAIVWHSLWWALAQIGTSIYWSSETYTFNSPGARNLEVSVKEGDPYTKELRDFTNNRNSDTIAERITNVKGIEWSSPISDLWVDIGKYRIDINTSSHSIDKILEAMEKMKWLKKKKVDEKEIRTDKHRIVSKPKTTK